MGNTRRTKIKMPSHYDTLNVTDKATPDELKRAYRAKAKTMHPDKGGDAVAFAEVSKAYSVLSDPSRRLLYDATGADTRLPMETEVQNVLMGLFAAALNNDEDIELLAFAKRKIAEVKKQMDDNIVQLEKRKAKLEAKRGKIKNKYDGVNLVHLIIDQELRGIEGNLENIAYQLEINTACSEVLEAYNEDWVEPEKVRGIIVPGGTYYSVQVTGL